MIRTFYTPLGRALSLGALILLLLPTACRSDGGAKTTPAAPTIVLTSQAPTAADLLTRGDAASYQIRYDATYAGLSGEFLWRRAAGLDRWDLYYRGADGGHVLESTVAQSDGSTQTCLVKIRDASSADVHCNLGGGPYKNVLKTIFAVAEPDLAFQGAEELAGQDTYCYSSGQALSVGSARMCLTNDGLPLAVESQFGIDPAIRLRATDVETLANASMLAALPWDTAAKGAPPRDVPLSDLELPDLPSLIEYLHSGD